MKPAGTAGPSPNGRRRVHLATGGPEPTLAETEIDADADLLGLDLDALARGELPAAGRPARTPLYLVCTNGRRDACCAALGLRVAQALAVARPGRVWECSHLGGHRFAANLVCLPDGVWFGRLDPDGARRVVDSYEQGTLALRWLRGRSSLPAPAQAAEAFLREREGLTGLHDLRVEDAGDSAATFAAVRGGQFRVRVETRPLDRPRPASCGERSEPAETWALESIERLR